MRLLTVLAGVVIALITDPIRAGTPDPSSLAVQLEKLRHSHGINEERDAGPEFTPIKQALRTWVEQQLPRTERAIRPDGTSDDQDPGDLAALSGRLNHILDAAGLTCGRPDSSGYRCGDPSRTESERGYLDDIHIALIDESYLLVVTGIGMQCGFDQSAYIYDRGPGNRWRLLLSIEQDAYGKDDYRPQHFLSIEASPQGVAPHDSGSPPLVAALGFHPWCSSNWQSLYTKLWRTTTSTTTPRALIDREDAMLYTGDDFVAGARLTGQDLLVQFAGESADGNALVRQHILHYRIGSNDAVTRVAPVALDPQAFIEEWLTRPWTEAQRLVSPSANRSALARVHADDQHGDRFGEFNGPPMRCRHDPTLWQVSFNRDTDHDNQRNYFKVQWLAPYDFTLVTASRKPFTGCDETVTPASTVGTLFPHQGWTP